MASQFTTHSLITIQVSKNGRGAEDCLSEYMQGSAGTEDFSVGWQDCDIGTDFSVGWHRVPVKVANPLYASMLCGGLGVCLPRNLRLQSES